LTLHLISEAPWHIHTETQTETETETEREGETVEVFEAWNRLSLTDAKIVFGFVVVEIVDGEILPILTVPSNSFPFFIDFLFLSFFPFFQFSPLYSSVEASPSLTFLQICAWKLRIWILVVVFVFLVLSKFA
jgi:hypothetical protein